MSLLIASCHRPVAQRTPICCAKPAAQAASSLRDPVTADASIYQLPGTWTDQDNHSVSLQELKGKVQVVAMIFTHCGYACPRLVQEMRDIRDSLPAADREGVHYVLVSFDSERDDPAQLRRYARQQALDGQWQLLHGNARQVRELSLLLNVKYQEGADGNYNHSNAVFILDKYGAVRWTMEGLASNASSAIGAIHRMENE